MMSIYRYSLLAATLLPLIEISLVSLSHRFPEPSTASIKVTEARPIQVIQLESKSQQASKRALQVSFS